MATTGPQPVDTQEFQFKLHCRFKIFNYVNDNRFSKPCNLIACASRYGLVFCGSNETLFQVIELKTVEKASLKDGEIRDYEHRAVPLPSCPEFISVNCDNSRLAVVVQKNGCCTAIFYDVLSFLKESVTVLNEVRLSPDPNVHVIDVSWNPTLPGIFTACKSDGTLGLYEFKQTGIEINQLPPEAKVTSMCWSPKGKQIAVGDQNGKITQYKPDLKATRVIEAPKLNPIHSVIGLQWISNYQFIGIYKPNSPNSQALVMVVDAPKGGETCYTNYEDICYSNGTARPYQFYLIHSQQWNVLLVASSNSMEVGVMGSEKERWTQWLLDDASRAELPLSNDRQDTLPVGMAFDTGSTEPVTIGENTYPPAPYLFLVSHHGLVLCFKVINLKSGAPSLCSPPDVIPDRSGMRHFTLNSKKEELQAQQKAGGDGVPKQAVPSEPTSTVTAPTPVQPVFGLGNSSNLFFTPTVQPKTSNQPVTIKQPETLTPQTELTLGSRSTLTQSKTSETSQKKTEPLPQASQTQNLLTQKGQPLFPSKPSGSSVIGSQPSAPNVSSATIFGPACPFVSKSEINVSTSTASLTSLPAESERQSLNEGTLIKSSMQATVTKQTTIPSSDTQSSKPSSTNKTAIENLIMEQEEMDAFIGKLVKEECEILETELKALLQRSSLIKVDLGSEEEISQMIQQTDSLQDFLKEVMETSATQAAEIHYLKQSLIQSWAWYEDAQSRYAVSKDPSMHLLQRSQPLDPALKSQLEDIRHMLHYLRSQLTQASTAIDERWETIQDSHRKTLKVKIPTMETVFQAMVKQNGILQRQKYILKDVASKVHMYRSKGSGSNLLLSVDNVEALESQLELLQQPHDVLQSQYRRIMRKQEKFTESKIDKLRDVLLKQNVSHITVNKPQKSSSLMQTIIDRTSSEKQLGEVRKALFPEKITSLLGADVSPISSEKDLSRNYVAVQSTPKVSDPIGLIRCKSMPATSFIFSPLTKADKNIPESGIAASGFAYQKSVPPPPIQTTIPNSAAFSSTSSSTLDQNKQLTGFTVPTTHKVFVDSSGIGKSESSSTNISATKAPSSVAITKTTKPPVIGTSNSTFSTTKQGSTVTVTKPAFTFTFQTPTTSSSAFGDASKFANFSFSSAFAPTTDGAGVFAAKGGSLFGSTTITPVQSPKPSTTSSSGFTFTTAKSTSTAGVKVGDVSVTSSDASLVNDKSKATESVTTKTPGFGTVGSNLFSGSSTGFNFTPTASKASESVPITVAVTTAATFGFSKSSTIKSSATPKTTAALSSAPQTFSFASLAKTSTVTATDSKTANHVSSTILTSTEGSKVQSSSVVVPTLASQSVITSSFVKEKTEAPKATISAVSIQQTTTSTPITSSFILGAGSATTTTPIFSTGLMYGSGITSQPSAVVTTSAVSLPLGATVTTSSSSISTTASSSSSSSLSSDSGTSFFGTQATTTVYTSSPLSASQIIVTPVCGPQTSTQTSKGPSGIQTSAASLFATQKTTAPMFGSQTTTTPTFGNQTSVFPLSGSQISTTPFFGTQTSAASTYAAQTTKTPMYGAQTSAPPLFATTAFGSTTSTAPIFSTTSSATPAFATTTSGQSSATSTTPAFGAATTITPAFAITTTATPTFNPTTSATPTFGATSATPAFATTSTAPVFGATTSTPVFGVSSSTPVFSASTSATPGFGTTSATPAFGITTPAAPAFGATTLATPIFGTTMSTTPAFGATTSATPVFGVMTSATPAFGTTSATPAFGTTTSATPMFGGTVSATPAFGATSTTPVFGVTSSAPAFGTTTSATPIFGTTNSARPAFGTTTSSTPAFGTTTSAAPLFGATTTATPAFGTTTSATPLFGATTSATPIFGSSPSSAPLFGTATSTTPTFGATTSTTSVFGAAPVFGAKSAFGASASQPSTTGSVFGSAPAFGSTNTFGGSTFGNVATTSSSVFGQPSAFSSTGGSLFGSAPSSNASIFGGTPSSSSGFAIAGPTFGTPSSSATSPFGSNTSTTQNVFGTPSVSQSFSFPNATANVPSSSSNFGAFSQKPVFGGGFGTTTTANPNSFSFGSVNLGTTTTSGGFGTTFGQSQNPFAVKPAEQKPAFGGGGSLFGKPATTASGSIFGGNSSATFGNNQAFGQTSGFSTSSFGQPAFGQSGFGSTGFGNSSPTGGSFSTGGGSVAQSGFGFGQNTQKPAFGSPPVFGSSPGFGAAPAFGSAPVFGGSPSFGSPTKPFGSTSPGQQSAFGSTQQNPTFANLANQNIGFGALAQQSNPAPSSAPNFSGGSSFSSWRS